MTNNVSLEESSASPGTSAAQALSLRSFIGPNADYYKRQFTFIGSKPGIVWTFNLTAAILGPIWYFMRGIWHWAVPFAFLEAFASVQIGRGLWGDLTVGARSRIETIELQLDLRRSQTHKLNRLPDNRMFNILNSRHLLEFGIFEVNSGTEGPHHRDINVLVDSRGN